jgi:hypothetical protein
MANFKDDVDLATSKRDAIVSDYLRANGVYNLEDAPGELVDSALAEADKVLGKGKNN